MALIPLQDSYFAFVKRYIPELSLKTATELFSKTRELEKKCLNPSQPENFDVICNYLGFLRDENFIKKKEDIFISSRLLAAPREYRLMLLRHPIIIISSDGDRVENSSDQLFLSDQVFHKIAETDFVSFQDKHLQTHKESFEDILNIFFPNYKIPSEEEKILLSLLKDDPALFCMYDFIGCFKFKDAFKHFPDDKDYEEDAGISDFLKREYGINPTLINITLLPSLKKLKIKLIDLGK
jgi:hypothetical protein